MNDEDGTLRLVAWSEVLPWLSLFRCFRLAIRLRLLLLSAVAILLTVSGWALFGSLFSGGNAEVAGQMEPFQGCPWVAVTDLVPDAPAVPDVPRMTPQRSVFGRSWEPIFGTWEQLGRPLRRMFAFEATTNQVAFGLLCGLWTLAVWAFFGGAVTRVAAVELASGERVGWGPMTQHVAAKWLAYCAAPLLPLAGVLLITILVALGGLILLHFGAGVLVAGLFWPLALVGGLLMAMLLLGLLFGWPLMWATISAEGTDSFDALSRSYAYVFQRPLHYLFYAVVAAAVGILGWLLVSNFAAAVVGLTYWAASWGGTAERVQAIMGPAGDLGMLAGAGAWLIHFWCECVKLLAVGFLYSYFWTASTGIYFLLRHDVDATEMDEVFLEEDEAGPPYGLPPLKTDDAGAPAVDEEKPQEEGEEKGEEEEKS